MKKILFPTDFSETANNAFIYAIHLAKSLDAELLVLHTFERPVISSLHGGRPELLEDVYTNIEMSEFDHFKAEVPKMREIAERYNLQDTSMSFVFENGLLVYVIKNIVRKENIDLIVMGTSGASGFLKKFWGTNTVNTIQALNVPVLSVPHYAKFHAIKNIGLTTTFKESDKPIVAAILKAAAYYDGKVKCLHLMEYSGNMDRKLAFANKHIQEWTELFDNPRLEFLTEKTDDLKKSVVQFVAKEKIDMLVIVKRNLSFVDSIFYSSLSKMLATSVTIPLMIVREPGSKVDDH